MQNLRFELRNKEQGIKIRLSGEFIRVGRAEDNNVILNDPSISRYHVNLYPKENSLVVEDAGSKTGFFVNGIAQRAPTTVKNGDLIKIGNQIFSVFIGHAAAPKEESAKATGFGAMAADNDDADKVAQRRRKIMYAGVAIFIIALALSGKNKENIPLADESILDGQNVSNALDAALMKSDEIRHKSRGEIEAEGKFREGMRDYNNGNFVRAINHFEEALTQNPSMSTATDYLQFSQARLRMQVKDLMQDGQRSYALMQYSRSKAQFAQVLSIMSEQIPGYWQQISQKSLSTESSAMRKPAQEETLLDIPCDRTKEQATCKLAVELIKQARQALGEEDTIR